MIYWLKAGDTGAVKVGYAARDVPGRVKDLQTGCPHLLVLLRQEPGKRDLEAALHRHYRAKHLRAEWYVLDDADVSVPLNDVPVSPASAPTPERVIKRCRALHAIRVALGKKNMTQKELAQQLGCSEPLVSHWIRGSVKPTLKHACGLESVLGIPLETWVRHQTAAASDERRAKCARGMALAWITRRSREQAAAA